MVKTLVNPSEHGGQNTMQTNDDYYLFKLLGLAIIYATLITIVMVADFKKKYRICHRCKKGKYKYRETIPDIITGKDVEVYQCPHCGHIEYQKPLF